MSQENVEIVRLMNAAFNRGDLDEAFGFYGPAPSGTRGPTSRTPATTTGSMRSARWRRCG
jgi:hypothetical protein